MENNIFNFESIEHFYQLLGEEPPKITGFGIIDLSKLEVPEQVYDLTVTCEFYSIMLNHTNTSLKYGTKEYIQESGLLTFVSPGQLASGSKETNSKNGWIINFSPKFLQGDPLLAKLNSFNFFSYEVNRALALSEHEEQFLNNIIAHIRTELLNFDKYSKAIIMEELGLILHYCLRIQEREIKSSEKHAEADIIIKIDNILNEYYQENLQLSKGVPDIEYIAEQLNISKKHLSKLVKESIQNKTTDYINTFVINMAKHWLLSHSDMNIKNIAYQLGFSYPHHFNNVFKKITGKTPLAYRND